MISSHRLWPRYGEQERAFFQCFDVVFKAAIKGQEISGQGPPFDLPEGGF